MISHITLGVTDMDRAARFYRAIAAPLALFERQVEEDGGPPMICFQAAGLDIPLLFISTPFNESPATAGNGTMAAFIAPSRDAVDAAHAAALAHGGTCEGPPGLRPHYAPDYYGAYFRDPDGNKLHVVYRASLQAFRTGKNSCRKGS
ncbi:VOC family protein [Jannaschia pohangensis]|uniref:Catechol 2,3-dioxygenase n=1 Tax=Jannaschia pohangensis TaxID=390807 RepID=A0A1I3IBZ4_9RHOB|nr:VOC family protein [Jannaschia pohangensis]SFI45370.1 Catechol 2,3-dioxygenase [Jannaschia pohangensis]